MDVSNLEPASNATKASAPSRRKPATPRAQSRGKERSEQGESLSQTNFTKVFEEIDAAAKRLIAEAIKASGNERRAAAGIVVEGVRLFKASESATTEWADLIKRELTDQLITVNQGKNFPFRVVANLVFRGVTHHPDDAEWADSMISRGQISRYARAMAWAHEKHKSGTPLANLANEITALGGMRKVADLWSHANRFSDEQDAATADAEVPKELAESPDDTAAPSEPSERTKVPLPIIGIATLQEAIATPVVCVVYPDGKVFRAPLASETMTTMVAQWEVGQ